MATVDIQTLTAVMDRLIPGDPDWPSASKNGVLDYLDHQLCGDLAGLASWLDAGLNALNSESAQRTQCLFAELPPDRQDGILRDLEAGIVQTPWPISPQEWFKRLNEWVAEGYYSDPECNRGNPEKLSWKMVGFDERK
jgi:hypothetical protein